MGKNSKDWKGKFLELKILCKFLLIRYLNELEEQIKSMQKNVENLEKELDIEKKQNKRLEKSKLLQKDFCKKRLTK